MIEDMRTLNLEGAGAMSDSVSFRNIVLASMSNSCVLAMYDITFFEVG